MLVQERFIPAPAGNGTYCLRVAITSPVHPRACGERSLKKAKFGSDDGSSPRLRGTAKPKRQQLDPVRFIPAPAGNGLQTAKRNGSLPVHPRACGERISSSGPIQAVIGSSPRLRGTAAHHRHEALARRFIPAPAGNGGGDFAHLGCATVHPRACGERRRGLCTSGVRNGSSPRLRGTDMQQQRPALNQRFIPAPAGNGGVNDPDRTAIAVHPRACGER